MLSRRRFVGTLGAGLLASPRVAVGQQAGRVHRIGLFHVGLDHVPPSLDALREGLKTLGYDVHTSPAPKVSTLFEGRNIRLDWRNLADEDAARQTARDFVRDRVDLIVAFENQAVRAAQAASAVVPGFFLHVSDPVAEGFVKSLARPGGNVTGIADYLGELQGKRLELLKELIPGLRRFLILTDHGDPATPRLVGQISRATTQLKVQLVERTATTETDLTRIFASLKTGDVDAVVIASPTLGRDAAVYVDRILRGVKPSDLPVQQASRLELVINLKTAKSLGLTIPPSVLLRADHVIE